MRRLFQKVPEEVPKNKRVELTGKIINLMLKLFGIKKEYTEEIYGDIGLVEQVQTFFKYNTDKALMNLGLETYFNIKDEEINPIVLNGLDIETKTHDFFSRKGNRYTKSLNHNDFD